MTDNTIGKEPKFKEGDVIYIATTNDPLYRSQAYGLYKTIVTDVYKDIYRPCPFSDTDNSIEYHYKVKYNPYVYDVCEQQFILTQKEFDEAKRVSKDFGHPYYWIKNMLFKIID